MSARTDALMSWAETGKMRHVHRSLLCPVVTRRCRGQRHRAVMVRFRPTRFWVARRAKHARCGAISVGKNIPLYRNSGMAYVSRQPGPWKRGVSRSSRRGPGGGGRGPHRRDGLYRAGNREQRPRANDRCDPRTAKSCGPGARSLCVKARGDVRCPTGRAHRSSARRRGQ